MTILGFSTSTEVNSVGLFKNGTIKQISWTRKQYQSEALTLFIRDFLKKNKVKFEELTLLAVDRGPGSFTGTRVAVNVAKTLAFDLQIPIFAPSSLDLLAFAVSLQLPKKTPLSIFTILDAHRSLFYFQKYNDSEASAMNSTRPMQALSLEAIIAESPPTGFLYLLGNLTPDVFKKLQHDLSTLKPELKVIIPEKKLLHTPQAQLLVLKASVIKSKFFQTWSSLEPSYIRSPDAVEKLLSPSPTKI